MSVRIILGVLALFALVSATGAQTKQPAGESSGYDCASNSGIKLDQTQLVNSIDTDKDSKVSKAEWAAIGAQEGIFSHTDKNTDGFMTVQELNDTTPPDSADADKDGKLTLPEFKTFLKFCGQPADSKPAAAPRGGAPQK
jgi:hypothetical protein